MWWLTVGWDRPSGSVRSQMHPSRQASRRQHERHSAAAGRGRRSAFSRPASTLGVRPRTAAPRRAAGSTGLRRPRSAAGGGGWWSRSSWVHHDAHIDICGLMGHRRHASTRINTRRWDTWTAATTSAPSRTVASAAADPSAAGPAPAGPNSSALPALLVTIVVGSGIAAERSRLTRWACSCWRTRPRRRSGWRCSSSRSGRCPGGHFNPVISAVDWFIGRRSGSGLTPPALGGYAVAQLAGGAQAPCWPT